MLFTVFVTDNERKIRQLLVAGVVPRKTTYRLCFVGGSALAVYMPHNEGGYKTKHTAWESATLEAAVAIFMSTQHCRVRVCSMTSCVLRERRLVGVVTRP